MNFKLLLEFTTGGSFPKKHALISCSPGEILLDHQACKIRYSGIQLRFSPLKANGFVAPVLSLMAMCFDDTDPENPSVKNVYEKIKPFLIPSIVVVVDWFLREENDEYDITANKLIESLRHVKDPESFQYSNGEIDYNIYEYYKQLALKTEVGMEFVKDYETGLKFLQT